MAKSVSGIIDPTSISFSTIKSDLNEFLKSRDDYFTWKTFLESGPGQTEVDMLSGFGTMLNFHSMGARREASLFECKLYDTAVALSINLDYPVNRISAPRMDLTVRLDPSIGPITWNKEIPIAYLDGVPISLLSTEVLQPGENLLQTVLGSWVSYVYRSDQDMSFVRLLVTDSGIDNDSYSRYVQYGVERDVISQDNITNQLIINPDTPDATPISLVKFAEDVLQSDGYDHLRVLIKTHPDGALLMFGDDVMGRKLKNGDLVKFSYIKCPKLFSYLTIPTTSVFLNTSAIQNASVTPETFTVSSIEITRQGANPDSLEKIVTIAPGYFSSKRKMTSAKDHEFICMSYPGVTSARAIKSPKVQATDQDGNPVYGPGGVPVYVDPCKVQMAYLMDSLEAATPEQKNGMYDYLDRYRVLGELLELIDPEKVGLNFACSLVVDESANVITIKKTVQDLIQVYSSYLGEVFRTGEAFRNISNIPGVLRVYPKYPISDKTLEYYQFVKLEKLDVVITNNVVGLQVVDPTDFGAFGYSWISGYAYTVGEKAYAPTLAYPNESKSGLFCRCLFAHTSTGLFNTSQWDFFDLSYFRANTTYKAGDRVYAPTDLTDGNAGKVCQAVKNFTSTTVFNASDWMIIA